MPRSTVAKARHDPDRPERWRRRPVRLVGATALLGLTPLALVACDDNGSNGQTNTTDVPISTVTTAVQNTSTSVEVPTSGAGAPPGLGTQPSQPGGTAQPNTDPGTSGSGTSGSGTG